MTAEQLDPADIFEGAERVEVLGRLPTLLWAFIDSGRELVVSLRTDLEKYPATVRHTIRLLDVLKSAARYINNDRLKTHLDRYAEMINALSAGTLSNDGFAELFSGELPKLEELAGPRRDTSGDGLVDKTYVNQQLEKMEKIKSGRSADIVVSVEILNDVRNYLATEVMTEGITSVLVIDNAGTLVVNMGDNSELDVVSLAAVAAANFAATEQIARLIGERDFVLLFYKGHNESFHFSRVGEEYIIVTIFNNALSLGLLRLKIAEVAQVLEKKLPKRQA